MKKYGILDKIPTSFRKKRSSTMAEGNEKNSTATGGDFSESELPDVKIEFVDGARR